MSKTTHTSTALPDGDPPAMDSFGDGLQAAVIGASGGIGQAFVDHLASIEAVAGVHAFARRQLDVSGGKVTAGRLDLESEDSIAEAAEAAKDAAGELDLVIVATGVLHDGDELQPEKTWRSLEHGALARAYDVNAIGPALVAKHFLPLLPRDRKSVFAALSARVGSISDNGFGGWHSYRASKAALNMLIRNFAIELARRNDKAVCVGLHPGTVESALSEPFQRNVPEGKLFTPAYATGRMLRVIDGLTHEHSGRLFAWDGEEIAP
ncbi:MAG: SDR family NAD(P)-dependent oxidoreductase [Rhodovibrionaceae bacterium]|nr:SDR family NAD(P)-dependent oxidoreductase [Rhodovibrionaceae bacterium]